MKLSEDQYELIYVTRAFFLVFLAIFISTPPSYASNPGDACSISGSVERDGGQTLICTGSIWKEVSQIYVTGRQNTQIDNDTGSCTADKIGRIRYASATDLWQYCTGSAWNIFDHHGCRGPVSCRNPGDVCTDGSVFAGCGPDNYQPFFATRCDAGQTWNGSACTGTAVADYWGNSSTSLNLRATGVTNSFDGAANTTALTNGVVNGTGDSKSTAGLQNHNATQYCADLSIHARTDWYLPSQGEIYMLWINDAAIGNFADAPFWSSTELDDDEAWGVNMTSGALNYGVLYAVSKTNAYNIRCIRK